MKEVRFKGKDVDTNDWVEGYHRNIARMCFINERGTLVEVNPNTLCIGTEINGTFVYSGDLHSELDGDGNECKLPIVFNNGAFWIDESFEKDGSLLTLAAEYEIPLNIIGNIHD